MEVNFSSPTDMAGSEVNVTLSQAALQQLVVMLPKGFNLTAYESDPSIAYSLGNVTAVWLSPSLLRIDVINAAIADVSHFASMQPCGATM